MRHRRSLDVTPRAVNGALTLTRWPTTIVVEPALALAWALMDGSMELDAIWDRLNEVLPNDVRPSIDAFKLLCDDLVERKFVESVSD